MNSEKSDHDYIEPQLINPDRVYHKNNHLWWLRVKLGAIYLNERNHSDRLCPFGCDSREDIFHFLWECPSLGGSWIQDFVPDPLLIESENLTQWWLHWDRDNNERYIFHQYVSSTLEGPFKISSTDTGRKQTR